METAGCELLVRQPKGPPTGACKEKDQILGDHAYGCCQPQPAGVAGKLTSISRPPHVDQLLCSR